MAKVSPEIIIGVDFSGAALAGEKIWIATGRADGGVLRIESLQRASELPGSAPEREAALAALREYLQSFKSAACGLDFPFSLSRESITPEYSAWRDWLYSLSEYSDADAFRESFSDLRRQTDIQSKTPLSPLNLRLYRQTFHGLRDVLLPLAKSGARVLPFDEAEENGLWLLEICPASFLKKQKLYLSYKGKSDLQRQNREMILDALKSRFALSVDEEQSTRALEDTEGDALDALLAALSTFRALQSPAQLLAQNETEKLEGKVYF
jgi:hypothetical protein